jgi:hypothetical protein
MPTDTQIQGTEIHAVKLRIYGSHASVTIAEEIRSAVNFGNGMFLGVIALGPCVILARLTDITPEGATAEMQRAVRQAYKEWEKQQAAVKK